MCAIIGVFGKEMPNQRQFEQARDTMEHRGPNDAGLYYMPGEGVALGFRRLSIIDLSEAGHQPFSSADGRFVVVFNGEIYNYLELRKELSGLYVFKTETDTEVLLASFIVWGAGCLQKLNGMFAFTIWDSKERKLFCARDRLGIKPFFYFLKNSTLYFSSEIKGLLALGVPRIPNEDVIFEYLSYGMYDHTEETFFGGIKQLKAGYYAVFDSQDGSFEFKQYWTLKNSIGKNDYIQKQEAHEAFKALMRDSIMLRFRSDVPVGIILSSGLDSNSLLYYSKNILGGDIDTFSMCYRSEEFNECGLIGDYLTDAQRKKWHTVTPEPSRAIEEALPMNKTQDQPFGGIPTIAMAHLYPLADHNNVTVLLSGQGLDELLGGYRYYYPEYEKDKSLAPTVRKVSSLPVSQDMTPLIDANILDRHFIARHTRRVLFEEPFNSHVLNAQYRDIVYTKLPRALRFNDHISMAWGKELRLPYLDYRLVEFCFSLPVEYKINEHSQKVLAREVMSEYLPHIVENTQKKTFSAAQNEWLRTYHKEAIYHIVNSTSFKKREYWNHAALLSKINRFFAGEGNNSFFLWQCINLELWFREFID
ncbi:MAG TPA: asparagine synthase (glutamine-hydrolyzing) [Candidatus Paceibacterota bacterium]